MQLYFQREVGVKGGHVTGEGDPIWAGFRPICSLLGISEAWTGAGVNCRTAPIAAVVRVMMQSLWGEDKGAVWVGEAIDAMGCSLAVGATKQVILELEYTSLSSMVVH